jgi:hypothetical protein
VKIASAECTERRAEKREQRRESREQTGEETGEERKQSAERIERGSGPRGTTGRKAHDTPETPQAATDVVWDRPRSAGTCRVQWAAESSKEFTCMLR